MTTVGTPQAPRLRLRLGMAVLVALGAVSGVMAQRPTTVVSAPSVQMGVGQPAH